MLIRGLVVTILLPIGYKLLWCTFRKCFDYLDTSLCSFEDSELMKPCFVLIFPTSLPCSILLESELMIETWKLFSTREKRERGKVTHFS